MNFSVRFKNKAFWITFIPALLLIIQVIGSIFGYSLELDDLGNKLLLAVNAVFALLTMLGIFVDPTTSGINDSLQAMTYDVPKKDAK